MLTEQDKQKSQIKQIESSARICEEAIAKAEKYERLKENKDFLGYLADLNVLVTLHDKEIQMGQSQLSDAPNTGYVKIDEFTKQSYVSSKQDWVDFIVRHQIQRQELTNWIKEPDRIITLASMAREKLPILKEKLLEITNAATASGNGKS